MALGFILFGFIAANIIFFNVMQSGETGHERPRKSASSVHPSVTEWY